MNDLGERKTYWTEAFVALALLGFGFILVGWWTLGETEEEIVEEISELRQQAEADAEAIEETIWGLEESEEFILFEPGELAWGYLIYMETESGGSIKITPEGGVEIEGEVPDPALAFWKALGQKWPDFIEDACRQQDWRYVPDPIDSEVTGLWFDLPDSEWENTVVIHPDDGTYRVWETKDGVTWGYGAILEPRK